MYCLLECKQKRIVHRKHHKPFAAEEAVVAIAHSWNTDVRTQWLVEFDTGAIAGNEKIGRDRGRREGVREGHG
jgi:hypothetical protein